MWPIFRGNMVFVTTLQEITSGLCPKPDIFSAEPYTYFIQLALSSHLFLDPPSCLFPSGFQRGLCNSVFFLKIKFRAGLIETSIKFTTFDSQTQLTHSLHNTVIFVLFKNFGTRKWPIVTRNKCRWWKGKPIHSTSLPWSVVIYWILKKLNIYTTRTYTLAVYKLTSRNSYIPRPYVALEWKDCPQEQHLTYTWECCKQTNRCWETFQVILFMSCD
jgi:hypothetical protein